MFRQELQRRLQLRLQLTATTSVLKLQLFQSPRPWSRSARCMRSEPPAEKIPRFPEDAIFQIVRLGKRRRSSLRKWSRWAIFRFSQKASFRQKDSSIITHWLSHPHFFWGKKIHLVWNRWDSPTFIGFNLAGWWTTGLHTVGGWKIKPPPTQPGGSPTGEPSLARGAHLGSGSNQGGWTDLHLNHRWFLESFTWSFGGEIFSLLFFFGGAERRDGNLDDLMIW